MKRILLFALLAAIASSAQGQNQTVPTGEGDTAVRVPAPLSIELPARPHRLHPGYFDPYRAEYTLSNGAEMKLTQRGRRIYAALDGSDEKELVAAASNIFVAKDRSLKMTLHVEERSDQITGVVLIRVPQTLAEVAMGREGRVLRLMAAR